MIKKVIVLGGGASGMMAAYFASFGNDVLLLEKKEQCGKKLSVTGNGKCNFTNLNMACSCYHGDGPSFISSVLEKVKPEDLIRQFEKFGMTSFDRDGYVYPTTEQAVTVVAALKDVLKERNVEIKPGANVVSVKKTANGFQVYTADAVFECDRVVLSMGSPASVKDKNKFNGYEILKSFGLSVAEPLPALCELKGNDGYEKFRQGVRQKGAVRFRDAFYEGEIQFTENGISGIPVFQISGLVISELQKKSEAEVEISLLPRMTEEEILNFLENQKTAHPEKESEDVMSGIVHKKLAKTVFYEAGILCDTKISDVPDADLKKLSHVLKHWKYKAQGYGDVESAQVFQGGLFTSELTENFECRKVPGLFVLGELVNADGICGGYNLHFAFSSGMIAGKYISEQ